MSDRNLHLEPSIHIYNQNKVNMTVELSYEEIVNYVERNFFIRPQLVYIDGRTVDIEYKPSKFLPAMSIRVCIDGCRNDEVCLSYDCSAPMAMIISGAVGNLGNKIPQGIDVNTIEKRVVMYLNQIEVLEKPLSYVELETISLCDDHIGISARLK